MERNNIAFESHQISRIDNDIIKMYGYNVLTKENITDHYNRTINKYSSNNRFNSKEIVLKEVIKDYNNELFKRGFSLF